MFLCVIYIVNDEKKHLIIIQCQWKNQLKNKYATQLWIIYEAKVHVKLYKATCHPKANIIKNTIYLKAQATIEFKIWLISLYLFYNINWHCFKELRQLHTPIYKKCSRQTQLLGYSSLCDFCVQCLLYAFYFIEYK